MSEPKHAATPTVWTRIRTAVQEFVASIERKVKAQATTGTITAVAAWLLGHFIYRGQVPESARTLIDVAAPVIAGALAGWLAKHTPRPPAPPSAPTALADPAVPGD